MTIRPLRSDEYQLAAPIFEDQGGVLPDPEMSCIIGAFDEQHLVGLWTVQVAYHAGPLWIHPELRGTRLWEKLHKVLCDTFQAFGGTGFYSFSGEPRVEHIFCQLGYNDLGYKVWKKEITHD